MKTIAQLETDVTIACAKRDAARKHQSALVALVTAFENLDAAIGKLGKDSLPEAEASVWATVEASINKPWLSALKSLRLASQEVERLSEEVVDFEAAFNDACVEAA